VQTASDELEGGHEHRSCHSQAGHHRCGKEWFEVKEREASIFAPRTGKLLLLARGQMAAGSRIAPAWKR